MVTVYKLEPVWDWQPGADGTRPSDIKIKYQPMRCVCSVCGDEATQLYHVQLFRSGGVVVRFIREFSKKHVHEENRNDPHKMRWV